MVSAMTIIVKVLKFVEAVSYSESVVSNLPSAPGNVSIVKDTEASLGENIKDDSCLLSASGEAAPGCDVPDITQLRSGKKFEQKSFDHHNQFIMLKDGIGPSFDRLNGDVLCEC